MTAHSHSTSAGLRAALLLALACAVAGCQGAAATSKTAASTAPAASQPSPSPGPSPAPRTIPLPAPSPSPSATPAPSGSWLHVAVTGSPQGVPSGLTDVVVTCALDPATGLVSSATLTDLPAGFGLEGIAVDASRSLVFATGTGDSVGLTKPGQLVAIDVAGGVPVLGAPFDMGAARLASVQPWSPAVDPVHGLLFATSKLTTVPSGPVTQGPALSFSYDAAGTLALLQPTSAPPVFPQAQPDAVLAVDAAHSLVYTPLSYDPNLGPPGIGWVRTLSAQGGKLADVSTTTQGGASCVAVSPSGSFVFSGQNDGTLTSWSASATGVLSNPRSVTGATGQTYAVTSLAVAPAGDVLLAACATLGAAPVALVVSLAIDPTTGALTPVGAPLKFAGSPWLAVDPGALAIEGSGRFAYVSLDDPSGAGGSVGVLTIGAGGAIAEVPGSPCALPVGARTPLGLGLSR